MMQNNKTKGIKYNEKDEEIYSCKAKQLFKIYDKESKQYIYKSNDIIIKINKESIKICNSKKSKENLECSFCIKHAFISRATDITIPRIDSCRIFSDPILSPVLLSFANPGIANAYEMNISKGREIYNNTYANISFLVNVLNKINRNIKESASVCISGLTTGGELKIWIEKEFNFPEILLPKYSLQLQLENNIQTIRDDVPVLMIYEHMNILCSKTSQLSSKAPPTVLCIQINLNISDKKTFYSIEEKWGAGMMPTWLMRLLSDLYFHGPQFEGVFRLNGKDSSLSKWYNHMLLYDDFLITEDIYNKAAIFKLFIRQIKGSLMTQNYKKEFHNICKKFIKISAEKYIANPKKKTKLLRLIQSLPRPHLFLLQNILVVIRAITDSEKTLFKPFSIAKAISPSIFPLMDLAHWKSANKLCESIILLTDDIVSGATRNTIVGNFTKFKHTGDVGTSDSISNESFFASVLSVGDVEDEGLIDSDSEIESTDEEKLAGDNATTDECLSSLNSYHRESIKSEGFSQESYVPDKCSLIDRESYDMSTNCELEEPSEMSTNCELDEPGGIPMKNVNTKTPKNICMGVAMKEIYRNCSRSTDEDLLMEDDFLKENNHSPVNSDRSSVRLRHKSLLKSENSVAQELNRSASAIVISPRFPRIRNRDSGRSPTTYQMNRTSSRKALSAVFESNNNIDGHHRSRSPNVKNLIKMYESKNKKIISDVSPEIECHQKYNLSSEDVS